MSAHDVGHATKHPRLEELEAMVRDGRIDTVIVAITDMQGWRASSRRRTTPSSTRGTANAT